ncbi:hypothetical protein BDZ94DRAFT_1300548 [Collybia nuda]|uniref:ATP-dependent DNA helicase n=1 Tax=Collybia nuda TaxID=64659 RepID=A0A9P5Y1F5_9AGAR|nr:hypothetical protein BDZ94DRAFT_1300548 [Collybia nuda]
MSSDGYFDGDEFDDAMFEELNALEAAILLPDKGQNREHAPEYTVKSLAKDNSFYDLTLDINESELQRLDEFIEDSYQGRVQPVAGPSRSILKTHQTTLFGDVLPVEPASNKPRSHLQRTKSTSQNPFGQKAPKTKTWDQTAFAKTGLKHGKAKAKAKAIDEDEDEDEETVEFEQFPAPIATIHVVGPPPPMKLVPDLLEAKHWIYPMNKPKRDYQHNIVKHCLFENSIIALPTGLGKTFIAGVVMLNYYRWFPDGKVVFVAPSKPLVAQQIDACHQVCGIPGGDAAELTGQIARPTRGRLWKEKRVFYMTPQTFINDLMTENCDPRDIILLVVDEAHRATGDYAYNQVVRFLMAKNSHFRILALTATPGGSTEAVQNLIDGLHISHIEIRDENSLDLKPYIHHKTIKQHVIKMTEDVNKVKDLLAKLMLVDIKPLKQRGVLYGSGDPVNLHPYAAQARMSSLKKDQKWAYAPLARVSNLARAMGYLVEGTLAMCYDYMHEISQEHFGEETTGKAATAASRSKKLRNDPLFQAVMCELEIQHSQRFSTHPKMDRLKALIVQHFAENIGNEGTEAEETKVMVFVTFRQVVDEIVETLNSEQPLIRATKFIGQGTDKQGKKGMAQKEQLEIIKKFKKGEFNVIVATSIGEEGLDIGEVDLILQRAGRTGRKRAGFVHVLLAEGREEFNLDKANETYKEVQKIIWRGEKLELYADVERLLPEHVKPQCLEKVMEIQEYAREETRRRKETLSPTKGIKRKRNDDVARNIPTGANTGFVSVADLLVKGQTKRKKASVPKDFELAGQDDDIDRELESGLILNPPRRTKSSIESTSKHTATKRRLRKSLTMDTARIPRMKKQSTPLVEPTSSQFSSKGIDDEDDLDIEQGIILSRADTVHTPHRSVYKHSGPPSCISLSPDTPDTKLVMSAPVSQCTDSFKADNAQEAPSPSKGMRDQSMAWLVDEDEDPDIIILSSSPVAANPSHLQLTCGDESVEIVRFSENIIDRTTYPTQDPNDSVEIVETRIIQSRTRQKIQENSNPSLVGQIFSDKEFRRFTAASPALVRRRDGSCTTQLSGPSITKRELAKDMLPPTLPCHISTAASLTDDGLPEPSFPIRPTTKQTNKRLVIFDELESPISDMPSPSRRRLHRRANSPVENKPRKRQPKKHSNLVFDFTAAHSGDETSEGSSHSEDDIGSESDRLFLEEIPETQVSPSYDQTLAYRQSLFTQAPSGEKAPAFAKPPIRHGRVFGDDIGRPRRRPSLSSSPLRDDSEPDEYVFGSFVVDDDADISYLSDELSIHTK